MNLEFVNNRVSQLPIAMAGIVHAGVANGIGLSIDVQSLYPFEKRLLP